MHTVYVRMHTSMFYVCMIRCFVLVVVCVCVHVCVVRVRGPCACVA